ncbi:hypothetical protein D3C87_1612900 [compost metagenome]
MGFVELLSLDTKNHCKFRLTCFNTLLHQFLFQDFRLEKASFCTNFRSGVATVGFHCQVKSGCCFTRVKKCIGAIDHNLCRVWLQTFCKDLVLQFLKLTRAWFFFIRLHQFTIDALKSFIVSLSKNAIVSGASFF